MYDDFTFFSLGDLTGPYLGTVVNNNGYESKFQVQFCGVSQFNSTEEVYTSIIWALDDNGNRTHQITGVLIEPKSIQTMR